MPALIYLDVIGPGWRSASRLTALFNSAAADVPAMPRPPSVQSYSSFGEDIAQPARFSVDERLNVPLESLAHLGRGEFPIDTDEEIDNLGVEALLGRLSL
jgi:hypothetical protein